MSQKRQIDMRDFLYEHSVFTPEQLAGAMGCESGSDAVAARLRYYVRTGRIRSISRGLYVAAAPGQHVEMMRPDPFLVAIAARPDAVFSHHSALQLLGAAHSAWSLCTLYARGERRQLSLAGASVRIVPHPPAFAAGGSAHTGTRLVERRGVMLRTTGPERTLVESFRQPAMVGGVAELVSSASGFATLDVSLLFDVLERYRISRLFACVGWFLERHASVFGVVDRDLALFERRRPKVPQYLVRDQRGGSLVSRWNVIVPREAVKGDPDGGES